LNLDGKVAVITGASSGIGKELALQLARKNVRVVLGARDLAALDGVVADISREGGSAFAVRTDVSKRDQVEALVNRAVERFGRLDMLINNAGVSNARGHLMDNDEADFRSTFEVNVMGGVYGVWAAVPHMRKRGGGIIVFVSSVVGKRAVPGSAAYCASKFALQGLTESIRLELSGENIRVLTVCPPGVDTPFFKNNWRRDRVKFRLHPVGKIGRSIVRACEKEKREVLLTIDAKAAHVFNFFFPRLTDWIIAKAMGSGSAR
jgi:NAD(P)-dependent dehydrogenase (short-subunit alcohol dehydrogenase family)